MLLRTAPRAHCRCAAAADRHQHLGNRHAVGAARAVPAPDWRLLHRSFTVTRAAAVRAAAAAPSKVLYVTQLDTVIRGDDLAEHFKAQPGFESAFVMDVDNEHLGYVQFSSPEAAAAAQQALDGSQLRDKRIRVSGQKGSSTETAADTGADTGADTVGTASGTSSSGSSSGSSSSDSAAGFSPGAAAAAADGAHGASTAAADKGRAAQDSSSMQQDSQQQQQQVPKVSRKKKPPPDPRILFLPALQMRTTQEQLEEVFRDQPGYESCQLVRYAGIINGYVTFTDAKAAADVLQAFVGVELNKKPLLLLKHERAQKEPKGEVEGSGTTPTEQPEPKQRRQRKGAAADAPAGEEGAKDTAAAATTSSSRTRNSSSSSGSSRARSKRGSAGVREQRPEVANVKVTNLAWSTSSEDLAQHFQDCQGFVGAVATLNEDGRASGVGFVKFATAADAEAAVQAKTETELDGRPIRAVVKQAQPSQSPQPESQGPRRVGRGSWALQVFGLAWDTTDADLLEHFADCQGVTGAFTVPHFKDNRPSGYGFVVFQSQKTQLAALQAKRNTVLLGQPIQLRNARAGRVEGTEAHEDGAGAATADVGRGSTVVLLSLPPNFTHREVRGMCSLFGEVQRVACVKPKGSSGGNGTNSSSTAVGDEADAAAVGQQQAGDGVPADGQAASSDAPARSDPCFVRMGSTEEAEAVVNGLGGRVVMGTRLTVRFANPGKTAVSAEGAAATEAASQKRPGKNKRKKAAKAAAAAAEAEGAGAAAEDATTTAAAVQEAG